MRIDLCLERIKFRNTQILSGFCLLLHELVHFSCHIVVSVDEIADLVMTGGAVHGDRRTLADGPHPRDNRRNPVGDGTRQEHGKEKSQHQDQKIDHDKLKDQPLTLPQKRLGRQYGHHKPFRFPYPVKADIYGLSQDLLFDKTVGGKRRLADIVIIQPVDTGKRRIRGSDQVVPVIDNVRNTAFQRQVFGKDLLEIFAGIIDSHISVISGTAEDQRHMADISEISQRFLLLRTQIKRRTEKLRNMTSMENTMPVGSLDTVGSLKKCMVCFFLKEKTQRITDLI